MKSQTGVPTTGYGSVQLERRGTGFSEPQDLAAGARSTFRNPTPFDERHSLRYRTQWMTFHIYGESQEAIRSHREHWRRPSPPPGGGECCHPARAERKHSALQPRARGQCRCIQI